MKNIYKIIAIGMLALVMVIVSGTPVQAASQDELVDMISEEMTANYLYTELAKKFPETKVFANLAKSEARHMEALLKAASRLGYSVEGAKPADITIPETMEEALAFALAYEQEDIDMLEKLIENEADVRLRMVLNNLLKGSQNHYNILNRAIEEGIDNLTCNENRTYQNRTGNQWQRGFQSQGGQHQNRSQNANGQGTQGNRNNNQWSQGLGQCQGSQRSGNCDTCQCNCR